MSTTPPLARRLLAEWMGSALLAAVVIGSGIAAQQLSPGDVGLELFENAAATAAGLVRDHRHVRAGVRRRTSTRWSPWSTRPLAAFRGVTRSRTFRRRSPGCAAGAILANGMFALQAVSISTHHRASPAHLLGEVVATARAAVGDLLAGAAPSRRSAPAAVGAYIGGAYWFTSSTSFANPAITYRPDAV